MRAVVKILSPWLGDIVESGIGLLNWLSRLQRLADPVRHTYARVDNIPQSGTKNLTIGYLPATVGLI